MIRALFVLPALQALFGGFVGWTLALVISQDRTVALGVFSLVVGVLFLVTSMKAYERYYPQPKLENRAPIPKREEDVRLKLINHDGTSTYYGEVPLDQVQLRWIVNRLMAGDTFAMDRWEPWFLGRRDEYLQIREGFLDARILEWVNPDWKKAGLKLTASGLRWCEALVGSSPPPPPDEMKRELYRDVRTRTT